MHRFVTQHMSCFHFPDGVFMIAWLLSVLIMFYIAFYYGYTELTEAYDEYKARARARNGQKPRPARARLSFFPCPAFRSFGWRDSSRDGATDIGRLGLGARGRIRPFPELCDTSEHASSPPRSRNENDGC